MIRFDGSAVHEQFRELFGEDITPTQAMWLIKVIKHCRGRCRSNAALRNYLVGAFPTLRITEVPREWKGREYMALHIEDRQPARARAATEESDGE